MRGWPLTKVWTVVFVLLAVSRYMDPTYTTLGGLAGAILVAFIGTWFWQFVVGWLQRRWSSFRGGGDAPDEDGLEDAPEPAD
jgi:hypothetical protein